MDENTEANDEQSGSPAAEGYQDLEAASTRERLVDSPNLAAASQTEAQAVLPRRLTPRRLAWATAIALTIVLGLLLAYLFYILGPDSGAQAQGETAAGLQPQLVITGPGKGPKPLFKQPMSAAWGQNGRIYVADTGNSRIAVFDHRGRFLFEFGSFGIAKPLPGASATWKPGSLNYPTGIAIDTSTGDVYVADFYNNTIEVFDRSGKFLRNFPDPNAVVGKGGSGIDGRGIAVTDVAIADGLVYATDAFQVLVFDRSGKLLRQFGKPGVGAGDLDRPNGIDVRAGHSITVSDSNHSRIVRFDPEGLPIQTIGQQVRNVSTKTTNPFILPRGLTTLGDASVMVADPLAMQLVRFDEDGKILARYGERGLGPAQLNFPNDVDARGQLLVVADRGNDRVLVVKMVGR